MATIYLILYGMVLTVLSTGNTCCDNPNLPWFYRELNMATMDDVEVRICTDESFDNE